MVTFTPFRLVFLQQTPVVLHRQPVHLDMLVFWSLACQTGKPAAELRQLMAEQYLTYDASSQVFHGSALIFGVTPQQSLTATRMTRVGLLREHQMQSRLFQPYKKHYTKLKCDGGPMKTCLNGHNAYAAPYLIFYGHGDPERVLRLLDFYLLGIGRESANAGWGNLGEGFYEVLDEDLSLVKDGKPNRYLPASLAKTLELAVPAGPCSELPTVPPYQGIGQQSVIPCEAVRSELMSRG